MSGGLLSGLNKAEERPYEGWKTNNFAKSDSPENDDVCLLEHDDSTTGVNDSPNSRKCLSDGPRNPSEFDSKDTSYKIPKKTVSTDSKDRRMSSWIEIDPSFNKEDFLPQSNCRAGLSNEKQRSYGHHSTQRNEIGYRICRQAFFTPRRFKHADAPGWRDCTSPTSQQEKIFSCQVPDTRHNGDVSTDNGKQSAQRHFKTLDEEREHNRSLLDSICQGRTLSIVGLNKVCESKGKNPRTNSTDSDTNFETNTSIVPQQDTPTSSKDENFDDLFSDHCENCTRRLSHDKKCLNCDKHMFPSQAATPRKPLSPERFYSGDSQKPKVQRTYSTTRGNGIRLLTTGTVTKHTDTKNTTDSCQTNSRAKKRKNKGKSNSDSDSENTPGRKKHNGKQLKLSLPKPVDVITLSDEEEEVVETTAEPTVDESQHDAGTSGSDNATVIPESPSSPAGNHKEDEVKSDLGHAVECSKTPFKRKTPPTKEQEPAKKKSDNLHGYTRDDLEIEIMIRADVRIGTLVCTATGPLKITCKTDEIKLSVDFGRKNTLLSIAGNDLTSFKIGLGRNLAVIVLSVTPGYALKLTQRIPNQGKFLNPGSAVAAERDIVLEMSENVTKDVIADLQEWVTDKLSKEFAELSIKDVERIKALKASPSISKEQKQAPSDATSTAMSTRSRTYNTRTNSSKQTAQTVQSLIVYPPLPQPERITVTSEDIPCLSEGEFLNDVIIDFYLKFVFFEKLKSVDRARTHIFSSFFYKQLTKRNNSNSDTFSSTPDRMHSQVKTWTKNVDIFEKDFVIVPINESSHWYLAVICFPGHTTATYINEIPDEEDETNSKNKGPNSVTEEAEKESENDNKKDGSDDDDDDDFQLPPLATLQSKSGKRSARRKTLPKQSIKSQPCILIFDSLGGQRQRCMFNLRNYLKVEWRERKKDAEPRDFNKDNIKGNHPKVPQQDNYCDCGVYVLQYMESFFEDPITDFSLPIKKPDWFSLETITGKRKDIRDLIYTLKAAAETGTS